MNKISKLCDVKSGEIFSFFKNPTKYIMVNANNLFVQYERIANESTTIIERGWESTLFEKVVMIHKIY